MARVSLIDEDKAPELAGQIERIKQGRRGSLINVYRLLLRSPVLAGTWFEHLNAVRWKTGIDGRLREILIIRVGWLTRTAYIMRQHVPKLALADGLTLAECETLQRSDGAGSFGAREAAAIAYADAVTLDVQVADAIFEPLRHFFTEPEIVEITVLIGTYNMHARVLNALELDLEP